MELMLSDHDLPVGLQSHLLAEADCGRLQLSRSRSEREREACSVKRLPLLSCMVVAHSQELHSCTSTTLY